ncbi:hypothetical protein [Xenorhabdus koppenhoeferi]|uniref:hypothetical protein n=1 Tax=Xenorhabdus koppenhoeferi TaxID=351659 RepID=UPI0015A686AD|nr:hypothetical protein [Xenorhabdus koppenhoeferi]
MMVRYYIIPDEASIVLHPVIGDSCRDMFSSYRDMFSSYMALGYLYGLHGHHLT